MALRLEVIRYMVICSIPPLSSAGWFLMRSIRRKHGGGSPASGQINPPMVDAGKQRVVSLLHVLHTVPVCSQECMPYAVGPKAS